MKLKTENNKIKTLKMHRRQTHITTQSAYETCEFFLGGGAAKSSVTLRVHVHIVFFFSPSCSQWEENICSCLQKKLSTQQHFICVAAPSASSWNFNKQMPIENKGEMLVCHTTVVQPESTEQLRQLLQDADTNYLHTGVLKRTGAGGHQGMS